MPSVVPSEAILQIFINSFFQARSKNMSAADLSSKSKILPAESQLLLQVRHSLRSNGALPTLANQFCYICHTKGPFHKHRPFAQCENFKEFVRLTMSEKEVAAWNELVSSERPSDQSAVDLSEPHAFSEFTKWGCQSEEVDKALDFGTAETKLKSKITEQWIFGKVRCLLLRVVIRTIMSWGVPLNFNFRSSAPFVDKPNSHG